MYPQNQEFATKILPAAFTPTKEVIAGDPPAPVVDPANEAKKDDRTKIIIWLVVVLVAGVLTGKYLWK